MSPAVPPLTFKAPCPKCGKARDTFTWRDDDPPEACPVCKLANANEHGDPLCEEAPDFCSLVCRDAYDAKHRALAENEAALLAKMEEDDRALEAWLRTRPELCETDCTQEE